MKLKTKNWKEFQHYKDRCPPWIKLHRNILNDRKYMCLPTASKALAPLLWLLACESKDGSFDGSVSELEWRLRMPKKEIEFGLEALLEAGFFISDSSDASTVLADRLHGATPEERRKETEQSVLQAFDIFWNAYPKKLAKGDTQKAWKKLKVDSSLLDTILMAIEKQKQSTDWQKEEGKFIPYPATWLNGRRWEDEISSSPQVPAGRSLIGQIPGLIA